MTEKTIFQMEQVGVMEVVDLKNRRLDEVVLQHYNDIDFLEDVLSFNNIASVYDANEQEVRYINLPERSEYEKRKIEIDSMQIAGVVDINSSTDSTKRLLLTHDKDKTVGTKKLAIVLDKIHYDSQSGVIKF